MFKLVTADLWMREANIHVETNNAKYGDRTEQEATINAGDVTYFEDFNLNDTFFKNATAGSNTTVRAVGVVMSPARQRELGVIQ
jgi:uncharacterized RmlC-like cupin family protein